MANLIITSRQDDLTEALEIKLTDSRIYNDMYTYFKIGLPNIAVIFVDWSTYEIMTLISGYIGVTEQSSQIICLNVLALMFQIPCGFQQAMTSHVGKEIGANEPKNAYETYKIINIFSLVYCICEFCLVYTFRNNIVKVYTEDH